MRLPETVRVILRFIAFRPLLVLFYLGADVIWGYAGFLVPGLLLKSVLDSASGHDRAGLDTWSLLALFAAYQAAGIAAGTWDWYSHQRAQHTFAALARANLLSRLLRRPGAMALTCPPAQAVSRFNSDAYLVGGQIVVLETMAEGVVIVTAVVVLVAALGPVTLVVMAPLVATVIGVSWGSQLIRRFREALQQSIADLSGHIGDVFGTLIAVRTLGAERVVSRRFAELNERRRRAVLRDTLLGQAVQSLTSQSYGIAIGLGLLIIAGRMRGGALTVGDLSLFVTYAASVGTMASYMGGDLAQWRQYGVSLRRLRDLAPGTRGVDLAQPRPVLLQRDLPAQPRLEPPAAPFRELRTTDLACRGIVGVDLELGAGELVVVTGRIGSGKTTLLRALLGLLPSTGDVYWNGERVASPATFMVPPRCGYLAQSPVLLTGTVRENLLLGLREEEVDLAAALSGAALNRDLAALPAGLDTTIGRRGVRLSGGQIQRVAAARMLARRPQVAMIDDLSSALDVTTEAEVWRHLRERRDIASLAVSHRRAVLRLADRIVVMRAGRVDDVGTLSELLGRCREMQALWRGER